MKSHPALAEWHDRLKGHDWTYNMSDDPGVYRRGKENYSRNIRPHIHASE